jgi:hypothetical protein
MINLLYFCVWGHFGTSIIFREHQQWFTEVGRKC